MATAKERMAATRARRRKSLVQLTVTMTESDLAEIVGAGYDVKADDPAIADEALSQFISDTVACLDVNR